MLKSLAEKILAAPLLNAESDPEFQRDALHVVEPNAFSLRPWGRPREVWLVDDRAEKQVDWRPLSDAMYAADRAIIVVFTSNGFRHPGVKEGWPSVTSINEALDSGEAVLFVKADYARAMAWTSAMTGVPGCRTTLLLSNRAVDLVAAKQ